MAPEPQHAQRDQPPGVAPLTLTGERTLPDVALENYWYRRHLAVYEWIAERVGGQRVVDLACGEGYGTAVLARRAAHVVGVDANPEAHEHARLKYSGDRVSFERDLVETWTGDVDAVVFLQTIEHVQAPEALLDHIGTLLGETGVAYVSTPNVLTLAGPSATHSGNPWHVREYTPAEFEALCAGRFARADFSGIHHAGKLRLHELAIKHGGWDSIHRAARLTKPFYDVFTPAISQRDFAIRSGRLDGALDLLAVLSGRTGPTPLSVDSAAI